MGLRKRISYHWRLFLHVAALLVVVIGILTWYQYKREADYREEMIRNELALINRGLKLRYQLDYRPEDFLNLITDYYTGSMFDGVRITVYNKDGDPIHTRGLRIDKEITKSEFDAVVREQSRTGTFYDEGDDDLYFYCSDTTSDGEITIVTALSYNDQIRDAISISANVWMMIALLLVIALCVTYLYTRSIAKSVSLLREFSRRASSGMDVEDDDIDFPRNEIGDISREIVTLYRERNRAFELINRERQVAMHAIEERISSTRQVTNNINHEIKTPVGIVKGYLETIISNPDMDDDARQRFLERMLINVERLCTLLNDLSTMTRLENGAGKILLEKVDMHDLAYQIDNDLEVSKLAGTMQFSYSIPLDCAVKGNFNLLNQMVCGLIKNAAMHSSGTEMGLKLISENERFYVFSFYDNGTGVGQEHLAHLFERFYRVDTGRSRKMGGTGLGLPIVKSTVISLGGTISVHNRSVGGLEFIFTLPKWE